MFAEYGPDLRLLDGSREGSKSERMPQESRGSSSSVADSLLETLNLHDSALIRPLEELLL